MELRKSALRAVILLLSVLLAIGLIPAVSAEQGQYESAYGQAWWQASASRHSLTAGESFYLTIDLVITIKKIPDEQKGMVKWFNLLSPRSITISYDILARSELGQELVLASGEISEQVPRLEEGTKLEFRGERIPTSGYLSFADDTAPGRWVLRARLTRVKAKVFILSKDVTGLVQKYLPPRFFTEGVELSEVEVLGQETNGGSGKGSEGPSGISPPELMPITGFGRVRLGPAFGTGALLKTEVSLFSDDGKAKVVLRMGTRALDALGRALDELICRPSHSPPEAPGWVVLAAYEFGPSGARFDPPVTLTTAYDPTKLPEGVAEEELILAQYNVATGEWEKLEDISVNTELHRISGKTTHFTQFAVLSPAPAPPPVVRYTLSIAVEPEGAGKVVLSPEQPAEGYEAGTRVTLTAQANPGYRFERWSGDVSGTQPSVTLTMDSAKRVVAHFAKVVVVKRYRLEVSVEPEGAGKVVLSPSQPAEGYEAGTEVNLTAVANPGYRFEKWAGDASGIESCVVLVMDGDKKVTADFVVPQPEASPQPEPPAAGASGQGAREGKQAKPSQPSTPLPSPGRPKATGPENIVPPTDLRLPAITGVLPRNGASGVLVNTTIAVTFSEAMDRSSVERAFSISPKVKGSFTWADNTLVFTPDDGLRPGTSYRVTVSGSARDLTGNALAQPYTWSFTTRAAPIPWWVWGIIILVVVAAAIYARRRRYPARPKGHQGR